MKQKFLLLFFLPLLFSLTNEKSNRTDWLEMNLKGRVKMLKEVQYEAFMKGDKIEKGNCIGWAHFYSFDEKGNKTEERLANPDGSESSKAVFSYDKNGFKKEVNTFHPDGTPNLKIISKYDAKGFEKERDIMDLSGGADNWKTVYKYDKSGSKIEEDVQHRDNSPSVIVYQYDVQGILKETNQLGPDGSSVVKRDYEFDSQKNKTKMTNTIRGVLKNTYSYKYEFDKTGNWLRQTEFDGANVSSVTEREITYFN